MTTRTEAEATWIAVLDSLEASLVDGAAFSPPEGLPALPASLLDRANALAERQRHAIAELRAERQRVADELSASRQLSARRGANAAPTDTPRTALSL